jgi:hypothetical protein
MASAKELPSGKIASFEVYDNKILVVNLESKYMHLGRFMGAFNLVMVRLGGENINRDMVTGIKKAGFKIIREKNLVSDIAEAISR